VLVEAKPARQAGWVLGTACRYVSVEIPGSRDDIGRLIDVTAGPIFETELGDAGLTATRRESYECR
jgi:hypothetical protein